VTERFDRHGGFRRLHSFTLATVIQLETLRFCRQFLTHDHSQADAKFYDPKGRQSDQMTQAASSGRQNIIEGSERSSTSKDTGMKLTDVARASLSELRGDYEVFILDRGQTPWSAHAPETRAVNAVSLDTRTSTTTWCANPPATRSLNAASTPAGSTPMTRSLSPMPCSLSSAARPICSKARSPRKGAHSSKAAGFTSASPVADSPAATLWQTGPSVLQQVGKPVANPDGTETVTWRVLAPVAPDTSVWLRLRVDPAE